MTMKHCLKVSRKEAGNIGGLQYVRRLASFMFLLDFDIDSILLLYCCLEE